MISKKNVLINQYGWIIPTFLSGGDGDDIYKVNKNSFAIIYDIGSGEDLVNLNSMSANAQSWVLNDVQGILISDGKTGALIINGPEIENVKFGGKTYNVENDTPPLGNTFSSLSSLESQGVINLGVIGLNTNQASLDYYINSAEFNNSILF